MSISGIQSGINQLITAVKPVPVAPATPAPTSAPATQGANDPSFFALSVLAQVLESEQTLLDGKNHNADAQNVVAAAASATAAQQGAAAYQAQQAIDVTAAKPIVNITV